MPCLVSLIWVLNEEAKTIWVCWLYSWINLLCKKSNSRWELGLILWKWKPNKKRIDWRERQRNKAKRIEEEQRMDNDKEISLVCWRSFESENQVTTHDLEQTDYLNELDIRTSASNKRFKSNSIYILSSSVNQTRCIQFINTSKLIITTASDINWSESWNIYSQLNSLLILSKTTDPMNEKQTGATYIDTRWFRSNHHSCFYSSLFIVRVFR